MPDERGEGGGGDVAAAPAADPVNHPAHYGGAGDPHEAIKVIEHMGWGRGFCRGSAIKYLLRAGRKGTETDEAADLRKALWFIDRDLSGLEREG